MKRTSNFDQLSERKVLGLLLFGFGGVLLLSAALCNEFLLAVLFSPDRSLKTETIGVIRSIQTEFLSFGLLTIILAIYVKHFDYRRWAQGLCFLFAYVFIHWLCFLSLLIATGWDPYRQAPSTLSLGQETALRDFLEKRKRGAPSMQDPVLGWVNAGMRDNQNYETVPPPGTIRISAFGDSFTYGAGVTLEDTWEKQLTRINPSIEVLNYGVGAYGLDQAFLQYLHVGKECNPHIVLIGYMSENIARNVNVFRPFYVEYGNSIFTKPRFKLKDGALVLLENPLATLEDYEHFLQNGTEVLAKLGENDYHYQIKSKEGKFDFLPSARFFKTFWSLLNKRVLNPIFTLDGMYDVESEAFEVTSHIFDAFYRKVLENGALPAIIVFPDSGDHLRSRHEKERRYAPLLKEFHAKEYLFMDMLAALQPYHSRYTDGELMADHWGHPSPLANRIIAEHMFTQLRNLGYTSLPRLKAAIHVEQVRLGVWTGGTQGGEAPATEGRNTYYHPRLSPDGVNGNGSCQTYMK